MAITSVIGFMAGDYYQVVQEPPKPTEMHGFFSGRSVMVASYNERLMPIPFLDFSRLFNEALRRIGWDQLSQAELGRRFDVSQTTVSFWRRGIKAPSRASMARVGRALGAASDELLALSRAAGLTHQAVIPTSPFDVQEFMPDSTAIFTLQACNSFWNLPGVFATSWSSLVLSNIFIDNPMLVVVEGDAYLQTGLLRNGSVLVINPSRSIEANDLVFMEATDGRVALGLYLNLSDAGYHFLSVDGQKTLYNVPVQDVKRLYPVAQIVSPNDVMMLPRGGSSAP